MAPDARSVPSRHKPSQRPSGAIRMWFRSWDFTAKLVFMVFLFHSASASRLDQAIEAISRERIHDDDFIRAVVLNGAGDVAPIHRTQAVGVLLKHEVRCR